MNSKYWKGTFPPKHRSFPNMYIWQGTKSNLTLEEYKQTDKYKEFINNRKSKGINKSTV